MNLLTGREGRIVDRFLRLVRLHRLHDETVLEESRRSLHLTRLPRRVEAFDISNIAGTHTVASMVVWENNQPVRQDYRKFKIRSVRGPDDFLAMFEVLMRRYRRAVSGEQPLPDLILVDGGKGQVKHVSIRGLRALGGKHEWWELCPRCFGAREDRSVAYK